MSQGLIEIIHEGGADQQVIDHDGLLCHRGITGAKNGGARRMETSVHATCVDKLKTLAVLQRALHDEVTSDGVVLETFEHLT
jgi:hypothetical protein